MYKFLIVDDTKEIVEILSRWLESHYPDCFILTGSNGVDAIHSHEKHPDITLTIIDQQMPGMTGAEAIGFIRKYVNVDTEFIVLTAHRDCKDLERKLDPVILKGPTVLVLSKPPKLKNLKIIMESSLRGLGDGGVD